MLTGIIYKIKSKSIPERIYIGATIYKKKRWWRHLRDLKLNKHCNNRLQEHYNKYGESDFVFEIIEKCEYECLDEREEFHIKKCKPYFNIYSKENKLKIGKTQIVTDLYDNSLKFKIKIEIYL